MGHIKVTHQKLCSVKRFIETSMLTCIADDKIKILSTHFYIFVTSSWENIFKHQLRLSQWSNHFVNSPDVN